MDEEVQETYLQYEGYVEDVLKKDLEKSVVASRKVAEDIRDLSSLEENIGELIKKQKLNWNKKKHPLDTLINLGISTVFAKAHVADTSKIFVDAGLRCHILP